MPVAREIAYDLTRRVNSSGAYLSLLLQYTMQDDALSSRDRAMVAELAYGVQRHRNKMDYIIEKFSSRPLSEIEDEVLDVLRLGVYQISEMRIPPHASVNETVDLSKEKLHPGAASFVNAVLRNTVKGIADLQWPSRNNLPYYLEIIFSHPRWLVDYILDMLDATSAEALCVADNQFQGISLRINPAKTDRESLMNRIVSGGGRAEVSHHFEEALVKVGLPRRLLLDLLEAGDCVVQDESSMLVGHVVDPQPGSIVVDACAAPGGKTSHLAILGGESCRVIAIDRNSRRLDALCKTVNRLGLANIEVVEGDSAKLGDYLSLAPDAILVDAPCSGLGTLRRRPELKWRRTREDLRRLAETQLALLDGCAEVLRPGGVMVYSVCTYTLEETTEVMASFLAKRPDYVLDDVSPYLPHEMKASAGSAGHIQLMPHLHDTEGMFVARLKRT